MISEARYQPGDAVHPEKTSKRLMQLRASSREAARSFCMLQKSCSMGQLGVQCQHRGSLAWASFNAKTASVLWQNVCYSCSLLRNSTLPAYLEELPAEPILCSFLHCQLTSGSCLPSVQSLFCALCPSARLPVELPLVSTEPVFCVLPHSAVLCLFPRRQHT